MRRVRPHLYVGPSVQPADVGRLLRTGITAILSLQQADVDLPRAAIERMRAACAPRISFHNIGIRDYDPDAVIAALPLALTAVDGLIRDDHVVYLHCSEGINRAPSVVLAYLVRCERLGVEMALAEMRRCDPGARPYAAVVAWLRGHQVP